MLSPHINIHRPSSDVGSINEQRRRQTQGSSNTQIPALSLPSNPNSPRGSKSSAPPSPRGSFSGRSSVREDAITIKWPDKPLEKAPELALLIKRPSPFRSVFAGDCLSKLVRLITSFCKNFNRVGDTGLANFKPVVARTEHTLSYVNDLVREYTINLKYGGASTAAVLIRTASGTSIKTQQSAGKTSKKSSTTSSKKQKMRAQQHVKSQLLKEFYERAYRTLSILQQCVGHFKTIIFALTYTRYAEDDLTESEAKMIRGKSIIGSYIWMMTYALQQMQEDPEVEQFENTPMTNPYLTELAGELQSLVHLSMQTWHELLLTMAVIERVNKKTEEVFSKQTIYFQTKSKAESEALNIANAHMRNYRKSTSSDIHELRNFKGIDPYANLLTWSSKRHASSRILYITEYTNPVSLWCGFDPLPVNKKIAHFKDLLNFSKLVYESVRESTHKINADLQGLARQDVLTPNLRTPPASGNRPQTTHHFTGITSYEDGIDVMEDILTKKLSLIEWNAEEVHEFFETDKVFLDDLDLLTLGACITRTILYEARHTVHVCYDTCRLLDYKEFLILPSYERLYHKARDEYNHEARVQQTKTVGQRSKGSTASSYTPTTHDAEEVHLELRNVAGLFRTSHYHEILKNLPIYSNRIGMTLQDPEMVFSPSSEKLLS